MKDSFAQLLSLGSKTRRRITIAIDVCCLIFTTYFALSFSRDSLFSLSTMDIVVILTAVIVTLVLLILSKSYRAVIRHLDVRSIVRTALSITFGSMIWIAMLVGSDFEYSNLLLVFLVQCTASLFLLIGYRSTLYLFISKRGKPTKTAAHVAIYGLSAESRQFAAGLSKSKKYKTVFFFSEDPALGGGLVDGIRVYSEDRLDWALKRFTPAIFLFPQSGESPIRQTRLISRLMQSGIEVKLFDSVDDSLNKHLTMEVARPIEIEDLLGRKENPVVQNLLASAVEGRRILVTGAAGSIGSQLCRRISTLGPASLSMLDIDESGLTAMGEEIAKEGFEPRLYLGSIMDREFIEHVVDDSQADTVIHAAAYKHVTMGEICASSVVNNNIQGTFNLLEAVEKAGIQHFIQVSTDKAVEPSNVMGASKLWCEMIVNAFASAKPNQRFASVRFGNVIESRGSVIPKFKKQISAGGPVTITHPKMQRYFMSISEAVDLVIQAAALTKGGETFVLDMGEPHYIMDVAKSVIQLAGKTVKSDINPQGDIEIATIGIQSGEKFEEKLFSSHEELLPSDHPSIKISRGKPFTVKELKTMASEILDLPKETNPNEIRTVLFDQIKIFERSGIR